MRYSKLASHYLKLHLDIDYSLHSKEMARNLDLKEDRDWVWYTDKFMQAHNDRIDIARFLGVRASDVLGNFMSVPLGAGLKLPFPPKVSKVMVKRDATMDRRVKGLRE